MTSYTNVRRFFNSNPNASFNIQVKVADIKLMDAATGQATSTFRPIRKLTTTEDDNFVIDKSDSFAEMLIGLLSSLTVSALVIGFITLLGAAIGLTQYHAGGGYGAHQGDRSDKSHWRQAGKHQMAIYSELIIISLFAPSSASYWAYW